MKCVYASFYIPFPSPKFITCKLYGRIKHERCFYCKKARFRYEPRWHKEKSFPVQLTFDF